MGTVKIPRWRVRTVNKRGDSGSYETCQTKREAQAAAARLRKRNRDMIAAKDKFWIGYKSIRIERTSYSLPSHRRRMSKLRKIPINRRK